MKREVEVASWVVGDEAERVKRLEEYYVGRGLPVGSAAYYARLKVDDPLANLCGDCGPVYEALSRGESVPQLAVRLGVHKRDVYGYLIEHSPVEWARWSAGNAVDRLMSADEALDSAETNVEVGRYSAIARNAQWNLERMAPRLYAAKDQNVGVQITVVLDPSCGGVVFDQRGDSGTEALVELSQGSSVGRTPGS